MVINSYMWAIHSLVDWLRTNERLYVDGGHVVNLVVDIRESVGPQHQHGEGTTPQEDVRDSFQEVCTEGNLESHYEFISVSEEEMRVVSLSPFIPLLLSRRSKPHSGIMYPGVCLVACSSCMFCSSIL